jgi:hypothetical protein
MPDYQKAKIYKLWSPEGTEDEVYIGSTCNDLRYRKSGHKCKKNICNSKILFEKYDDVRIELVEDYPCNNRAELNKREGEYIRENNCLNKNISGRTPKEWREDNKEKLTEQKREYDKINKEQKREYALKNKEKKRENGKKYYENNKEKKREYQLKNKERISEKHRERYLKKKEEALIKE